MASIKIKNVTLQLNPNIIQTAPSGRPIRYSGLRKNTLVPDKWIGKVLKSHWIYSFRYMDDIGGYVEFEFGYKDEFIKKL